MPKPKKIILGLVGEMASGKDTAADYLAKKYRSQTISFSQPLRDVLDKIGLPQTRENMANLGTALRETFSENILEAAIIKKINSSKKPIACLPNIRLKSDFANLQKIYRVILIHINTSPKIRYQRIIKRRQNVDDKNKTWQQFLKDSKLPTETQIRKIAKTAKFIINNDGNHQELYRQINLIMKKLKLT